MKPVCDIEDSSLPAERHPQSFPPSPTTMSGMTNVVIWRAGIEDLAALTPLVDDYRAFYKQVESSGTKSYLAERITNDEAVIFMASLDGMPVGFTLLYPTFSTVALAPIWLLNDLFVTESARGHGVASRLMEVAEQAARDAGAARVWLRTAHDNTAAQALYQGRGWVEDEIFRRYDLIF
jgi:GNAT superfamily N-acetyltransferase